MISVAKIQSSIQSKKPISFWYSYSHPDTNRVVEPISVCDGTLVARENGAVKRFKLDGINLIEEVQSKLVETLNEMIRSNATMVFTYSFATPKFLKNVE